ncbi:hypothetical protein [Pedobacter endophyticus]|uniref:Uncharacterized protein n=1 Tax=Pedobacter endophyticus TaxID=2789740 RepID=A0A7S9L2T6_9SPHI|nr:hypothetical protein [Pedobacter endophyticus]QPH41445.1 hypothetical protein IZT61_09380 [Pedobacter endophyticus]
MMKLLLTSIVICFCQFVAAQPPLQQFWVFNKARQGGTGLLDQIGSTGASMAYSVRKLRTAYAGPAMRVRRGTGTALATADVAFNGTTGAVDANSIVTITSAGTTSGVTVGSTMAFSTFYNGVSVYVATWYDQSGNARNVTQATESKQPRIVNAGVIDVSNTKTSVLFTGASSQVLQVAAAPSTILTSGYIGTASAVFEASSGSTVAYGFSPNGSGRWQTHANWGNFLYFDVGSGSYARFYFSNSGNVGLLRTYMMIASATAPRMQVFISGASITTGVTNTGTPSASPANMTTFNIGGTDYFHTGHQSEMIIFPVALGTNEITIVNNNQKAFYNTP